MVNLIQNSQLSRNRYVLHFRILVHDVNIGRYIKIKDKNSQPVRKLSLPHSDAHRNGRGGDDYDLIDKI